MKKIDRFDKYMKVKRLNDNKVTVDLGLSVGTIGKSRKEGRDLSDKVVEQILNFYTDLNPVYLLTGEGEMLKGGTIIQRMGNNCAHNTQLAGGSNEDLMQMEIDHLKELLQEKERVIQILLEKR